VIKTDDLFTQKDADFDCIWLLQKCKMAAAGVNDKANKHATLFQSILHFCTIKQGQHESNDSFRKRLDSAVLTLELAGGKHILVSDVLLKAADVDNPTTAELDIEEEKFKAMVLIMRADPLRYTTLQSSL
jgi:ribosomal protein L25 (general stress protein Ctc)